MKNNFLLQSLLMFFLVMLTFVFIRGLDGDIIQNEYYNNYDTELIGEYKNKTTLNMLIINDYYLIEIVNDSYTFDSVIIKHNNLERSIYINNIYGLNVDMSLRINLETRDYNYLNITVDNLDSNDIWLRLYHIKKVSDNNE